MKKYFGIFLVTLLFVNNPSSAELAGVATASADSSAKSEIEFVNEADYTDIDYDATKSEYGHQLVLKHLKDTFSEAAEATILNGYKIRIMVTDVDLAGAFEPGGDPGSPRIGSQVFSPRIDFKYELIDPSGHVVIEGFESLDERNYPGNKSRLLNQDYGTAPGVTELILQWFKNHKWPEENSS